MITTEIINTLPKVRISVIYGTPNRNVTTFLQVLNEMMQRKERKKAYYTWEHKYLHSATKSSSGRIHRFGRSKWVLNSKQCRACRCKKFLLCYKITVLLLQATVRKRSRKGSGLEYLRKLFTNNILFGLYSIASIVSHIGGSCTKIFVSIVFWCIWTIFCCTRLGSG